MSIEQDKIVTTSKVSLFIRERPSSATPLQHLRASSPISTSHPKSYPPPQTPKTRKNKSNFKNDRHQTCGEAITSILNNSKSIKIHNPKTYESPRHSQKEFSFDKIFAHNTTQEALFEQVALPVVKQTLNGFNACCFAYGQTGSGKTYSIFGDKGARRGLLPRSLDYLFEHLRRAPSAAAAKKNKLSVNINSNPSHLRPTFFTMIRDKDINPPFCGAEDEYCAVVTFLEIYLDRIRDLGLSYLLHKGYKNKSSDASNHIPPMHSPRSNAAPPHPFEFDGMPKLEIREDANGQIFVQGLHHIPVESVSQALEVMQIGLKYAQHHSTLMNDVSSRSHTIFTVSILQRKVCAVDNDWSYDITDGDSHVPFGYELFGRMHYIDLAGSERLDRSGSEGIRKMEAVDVNKSLTALGKVIISLSKPTEYSHVPYRDSKLTRILQNSLSGNCYTTLLCTVNPYESNYEETLQTLLFAHRCTNVYTRVHSNYFDHKDRDKIDKLRQRIQLLLKELSYFKNDRTISPQHNNNINMKQLHGDLNGLVDTASSLLLLSHNNNNNNATQGTRSHHHMHPIHQMNQMKPMNRMSTAAHAHASFIQNIDLDRIHDLQSQVDAAEKSNSDLHDRLHRQSETYNTQTSKLRSQMSDFEARLEGKEQSIKHLERVSTQRLETQRSNLLTANKNVIQSMLITLQRTPTYSLRSTIRALMNQYKLSAFKSNDAAATNPCGGDDNDGAWTMTNDRAVPSGFAHIPREEFEKLCRQMEVKKKKEQNQMKLKFRETLNYKTARISQLKGEMERIHREHEAQHKELQNEFAFLYKCLGNLTGIIEAVERGHFKVHITSGIKKIRVAKSTDTDHESISSRDTLQRCETLKHLLHRSDSFIERQLNATTNNETDLAENDDDDDDENIHEIDDEIELRQRLDSVQYYQKQASQTRNALHSLRIAFESQKRQLYSQDERIKSMMISRSNSVHQPPPHLYQQRKGSVSYRSSSNCNSKRSMTRANSVKSIRSRPNSAKLVTKNTKQIMDSKKKLQRPHSAHRSSSAAAIPLQTIPFAKLSTNHIVTRFGRY
eukprot:95434_1